MTAFQDTTPFDLALLISIVNEPSTLGGCLLLCLMVYKFETSMLLIRYAALNSPWLSKSLDWEKTACGSNNSRKNIFNFKYLISMILNIIKNSLIVN